MGYDMNAIPHLLLIILLYQLILAYPVFVILYLASVLKGIHDPTTTSLMDTSRNYKYPESLGGKLKLA
jgi:uncharacterized membrane protein